MEMTGVLVWNFRKHPWKVPESHLVGVTSNSFTPLTGTNSEKKKLVSNDMIVFKQKLRSKSYLCNKYGYGSRYFIRLMTLK